MDSVARTNEFQKEFKPIAKDVKPENVKYKLDIVWTNVVLLFIFHVGAVYGFFIRNQVLLSTTIFWKIITILTGYGITAGGHRLWSHRSYKANYIAQTILMICMSMSHQNSVYIWSRDHRLHHKYSETDADPHNPKRGFFYSHIGWLMVRKHKDVIEKGKTLDLSDLRNNPLVMFQHRYYYIILIFLGVIFPTFVPWYFFGETLYNGFFVATLYRYFIAYHVTWGINSFAHSYGYQPYDVNIGPTENTFMSVFSFGEGFHNYHHAFPCDYKASEYGSDPINSTTSVIDLFAWLGWVTDRKSVPKQYVDKRIERTGNVKAKKIMNRFRDGFFVILFLYLM